MAIAVSHNGLAAERLAAMNRARHFPASPLQPCVSLPVHEPRRDVTPPLLHEAPKPKGEDRSVGLFSPEEQRPQRVECAPAAASAGSYRPSLKRRTILPVHPAADHHPDSPSPSRERFALRVLAAR